MDNEYSLIHTKNYNNLLKHNLSYYMITYTDLIINFIKYISINKQIFKNKDYMIFNLIRGFKAIKHIYNMLLLYTKNLELTIFHCKKSYIYYVEFIGQIGDDNNSFLQLNSKDATLFVYKRTIYELNTDYKKKFNITKSNKIKHDIIYDYTNIINDVIVNYIKGIDENKILNKDISNNILGINKYKFINIYKILCNNINTLLNNSNNKIILDKIKILKKFVKSIERINIYGDDFLTLYKLFLKKLIVLKDLTKVNIYYNDYDDYVKTTKIKFINKMFIN